MYKRQLLEPAALGRPVVAGPYTFNDPAVTRLLTGAAALVVVEDAGALAAAVAGWWADPAGARAAGARGRAAMLANQGALARLVELIARRSAPAAT